MAERRVAFAAAAGAAQPRVGGTAQGSARAVDGTAAEGHDLVEDRTRNGRKFRMLNVADEFTRECLCVRVARKLKAADVIDVLADLFITRGVPGHIRSDNGPKFAAVAVKGWITGVRTSAAFIEPGNLWENGYVESFNGKLRDELLIPRFAVSDSRVLPDAAVI